MDLFTPTWGWHQILNALAGNYESGIDTVFDELDVVDLENDKLLLVSRSPFRVPFYQGYLQQLSDIASQVWKRSITVEIVDSNSLEALKFNSRLSEEFNSIAEDMTFDSFQVSRANRFAHAAAKTVAQNPGKHYNPLIICGDNGTGKTHLLYAIGNEIKKQHPTLKVAYVNGNCFVEDLIFALRNGARVQFEERYHQVDVLLMDDIQFIAGKVATQEEFFHLFDYFYQNKKQIIVGSDRPMSDFTNLEHRLITRLSGGLVADIAMDDEAKLRMVQHLVEHVGVDIPDIKQKQIAEQKNNGSEVRGEILKYKAHIELERASDVKESKIVLEE